MIDIKNIINLNNIKEYWTSISGKTKKILAGLLIFLIIASTALTVVLNTKDYIELYSGISNVESMEVMKELQEINVEYRYENTGSILIDKDQEDYVRMHLAQLGHPKSGTNYDVFTQNIDFMTTDYEKKQYELYQLQERLQSAIRTIDGVSDSIVTISLPDNKSFAWETESEEATASVKLMLQGGTSLSSSQVKGIIQLITKSVMGLSESNVVIIDNEGNSLDPDNLATDTTSVKLKLELERNVANETTKNVTDFLSKIYGEDNIKVSSKAKINLDKKIEEILRYMPEEGTQTGIPTEARTEREVAGPGETTGGVIGTEANAEVPTYPGVTIEGDDIYFKDVDVKNYVISQLKQQIDYDKGTIESLSVAVVINRNNMAAADIDKVKELVAYSEGIELEDVSVQSMEFFADNSIVTDVTEIPDTTWGIFELFVKSIVESDNFMLYVVIAVMLLVILGMIVFMFIRNKKRKETLDILIPEENPIDDVLNESEEFKTLRELREFSEGNPEIAAQFISRMLRGDE